MAFPGDYTLYQEVTIDHTKVDADLTDFPIYIDLSDLDKAGNDIFDTCRSDGGDIRVTKDDGTTQLPREVVSIDTTGKTGELHVKFDGTLSSSSDTTIRIWYNGTDTEPAADSTYGSEAVWSDTACMYHGGSSPIDSSGNTSGSYLGSLPRTVTGKIGDAQDSNGSDDRLSVADDVSLRFGTNDFTASIWVNADDLGFTGGKTGGVDQDRFLGKGINGVGGGEWILFFHNNSGDDSGIRFYADGGSINISFPNRNFTQGTWYKFDVTRSGDTTTIYANGSSVASATGTGSVNLDSTATLRAGSMNATDSAATNYDGKFEELRIINGSALSSNWISTEYNNQNSPSTFYSTSDEQEGTTAFTPIVMSF